MGLGIISEKFHQLWCGQLWAFAGERLKNAHQEFLGVAKHYSGRSFVEVGNQWNSSAEGDFQVSEAILSSFFGGQCVVTFGVLSQILRLIRVRIGLPRQDGGEKFCLFSSHHFVKR